MRTAGFICILIMPLFLSFKAPRTGVLKQEGWDSTLVQRARAAATCSFMTQTEQDVIYYTNLVRLDPALFENTILAAYLKENYPKPNSYTRSLQKELKKCKPLPVFSAAQDLFNCAFEHAEKSGKKGTTGHQGLDARMKKNAPGRNPYGENCDYGNHNALDIVMSWLIDDGISTLSHRKNLLDKDYTSAGVSVQPHKRMNVNAVMCFGK